MEREIMGVNSGGEVSRNLKCFVIFMVGIILSGIITVMYLTESINLACFYDVGDLYEISSSYYKISGENWLYDYEKDRIVTQEENASFSFQMENRQENWNYFSLEIQNLSNTSRGEIEFLGKNDERLYTIDFELRNGRLVLPLQKETIYALNFIVRNPVSFSIKKMQFREKMQNFEWSQAPGVFVIVLVFYFLIILLILYFLRHYIGQELSQRKIWIKTLQKSYECLLEQCGNLFQGLSSRNRSLLRRITFFSSMLLLYFMLVRGWYWKLLVQRKTVLLLAVCILFVAVLSWEKTEKAVNWNNPLVYAWIATWLMCILSEFVIEKDIKNTGIFMLGVMGPLYMVWGKMKRPERLIGDFLAALRWCYWISCVFCFFFRSFSPGIRYSGIYTNPNLFAGFLVTANIAFLISLDENLSKERLKKHILWGNIFGLVTIWGFLRLTESVTSLAAYALEWVVFLWKQFPTEKKTVYKKNLRNVLAVSAVSMLAVITLGKWGLSSVPNVLGTDFLFHGEQTYSITGMTSLSLKVEAAEQIGVSDRLLHKVTSGEWNTLFGGRTEVWKEYIQNWNLFGHAGHQECFNGKKMHAHNALLQMIHYYGIFICVPYLIMLYYSLKYGIKIIFNKKQIRMNLFFLLSAVNYIVLGFAEDVATSYLYISWLTYYISLGGMFHQQKQKTGT